MQASATGTVWVLERASDGARAALQFAGSAAGASLAASGTAVVVTALATGWVHQRRRRRRSPSCPTRSARSLLYNERVTR